MQKPCGGVAGALSGRGMDQLCNFMFAGLTDRSWLWIAAGFYLAGLILGTFSLLKGERQSRTLINSIIILGYLCQLGGLYLRGKIAGGCPLGNTFEIFQFTAWSA